MAQKKKRVPTRSQKISFFNEDLKDGTFLKKWDHGRTSKAINQIIRGFQCLHPNKRMWLQVGVESENDWNSKWHNYYFGVVVKAIADYIGGPHSTDSTEEQLQYTFFPKVLGLEEEKNIYGVFKFAKKEYAHSFIKKMFFKDKVDPDTGLAVPKSFSKDGNIGEGEIRERVPYIQRWAQEFLNVDIPDFGEMTDRTTGELHEVNMRHDEEYRKTKDEELEVWKETGPRPEDAEYPDDF